MIGSQKHLFTIPDHITYLNCAYLSPQLRRVSEAGQRGMALKEAPWDVVSEDFFTTTEETRGLFAELIDAKADEIAFIPAASYGISVAAKNLKIEAGEKIIVLEEQFPSNVYPWEALAKEKNALIQTINRPEDGDWTKAILAGMDEKVAIVALPHCIGQMAV